MWLELEPTLYGNIMLTIANILGDHEVGWEVTILTLYFCYLF